jgi:MFS family permease
MSRRFEALGALRHRDFKLFWFGQLVSLCGSMMQSATILWHVTLLCDPEHKGAALALVGAVKFVPIVVCSLLGGAIADVFDRRKLLLGLNVLLAVVAAGIWWTTRQGSITLPLLYLLAGVSSVLNAFEAPARMSLVPSLVPEKDLPHAINLNMILFQGAAVAGPALSGLVMALLGVEWCYLMNALSFLGVVAALTRMSDRGPLRVVTARVNLASIAEGLRFVWRHDLIRSSMLLDFLATFFASAVGLLPMVTQDVLGLGDNEAAYGWLVSAQAIGAFAASLVLAEVTPRIVSRGRVLIVSVVVYGLATIAFGLTTSYALMFACLALSGAADTVSAVLRNLIRQLGTPDHLRGRMSSVNMIFFMGGPQLGELEAGLVAQRFGAPFSIATGGIACVLATLWIAAKTPRLRRYQRDDPVLEEARVA